MIFTGAKASAQLLRHQKVFDRLRSAVRLLPSYNASCHYGISRQPARDEQMRTGRTDDHDTSSARVAERLPLFILYFIAVTAATSTANRFAPIECAQFSRRRLTASIGSTVSRRLKTSPPRRQAGRRSPARVVDAASFCL